jgi:hypothetical protein
LVAHGHGFGHALTGWLHSSAIVDEADFDAIMVALLVATLSSELDFVTNQRREKSTRGTL